MNPPPSILNVVFLFFPSKSVDERSCQGRC
jgi:hypothetical protein